ncbi:hypothetical protein [Sagittula sp. S175]|uniref:hypothetical protein n=1 Tax=Sagittula sp. S175 TaxID=3415129 RepID=UPI003C7E277D
MLVFATLLTAALIAWLASLPRFALLRLALDDTLRPKMKGLFMVRGINALAHYNLDAVSRHSYRYRREAPFDLKPVAWALGLSGLFVTTALCLGWLIWDIPGYGGWNYFTDNLSFAARLPQTLVTIGCMLGFVLYAGAIEWEGILPPSEDQLRNNLYSLAFLVFFFGHKQIFGDHGLILFTAPLLLLVPQTRGRVLPIAVIGLLAIAFGILFNQSPSLRAILVAILVIAVMTWVAWTIAVEVLATVKWYDPEPLLILAGHAVAIVAGLLCAIAAPLLTLALLPYVVPDAVVGETDITAPFRNHTPGALITLAIACSAPLIPALNFLLRGLGDAIANATPAMKSFLHKLETTTGELDRQGLHTLFAPYRKANALGFAVATVIVAQIYAALLMKLTLILVSLT